MKETIVKFVKGPFPKKYTAHVRDKKTKKTRKIHFGDRRYQQYKDRTDLKLYAKKNHGTRKRMQNYYNRHSGTKNRKKAIDKEIKESDGFYTAKILSHQYLW
jgi:type IV secretory pathway TraG/TraD family ATPase VirD4